MPTNVARSLADHSHSRFCSTDIGPEAPNVSLLSVVSIWKTFTPASREDLAHAPVAAVQLGAVAVHEAAAVLHRLHVVVVAQAAVAGQAGGGGLVAAVHRHQVDVHVDEQVALGGPLVDLDLLALGRGAQEGEVVGVLGVVVVEQAVGGEGVVDPVADGVAQLGLGHAAVQGEGGDDVDVVDAGLGRQVEHRLDDALAHVGAAHGRQRQRDVVEGDRQLHARAAAGCAAAWLSPSGWSRAWRMAPSGSSRASSGSPG